MEKDILYRFFSGEATQEQEQLVIDWLDAAPEHRAQMLAQRRIYDAMLLHGREKATARKRFALPSWTHEAIRYAAVVALAVIAGITYLSHRNEQLLAATNTISVPAGQRVNVTLPDGTQVCLNALSTLTYPSYFAGDIREVNLTGEAFFDVHHDAKQPFVVQTYACNVRVLGTKFDVEAHPDTGEFAVSLVEGSVKVGANDDPANSVVLSPNERASYNGRHFVVGSIPAGEDFLWRDGLIGFRNASFADLLDKFEKYYDVKIEVRRQELPATSFTGKIRIAEGIDHALWVLKQSADFTYSRSENRDTIYIQ